MRFRTFCIMFVLGCAALLIFIPVSVIATEINSIPADRLNLLLENIENNFSKIKTLKTMLIQEKSIPVFSEKIFSKGFCIFKSPDKLRLEFTQPFKSSLIVNGNHISQYEFFDGTWQKLSTGNKEILLMIMGNITSWLKGKFKDPKLYKISAFENEKMTIVLTPKADEFKKFITSFELGLNNKLDGLEYIIINETKNAVTKIQFYNDQVNTKISDTIFQGTKNGPTKVSQW
ncbi:MAG: outer membrane lipoprotein carrier protein LolA [Desulfobacula sp.]|nr:outer membrane lipoprotein carrier protein LolA [Desulfobacula sp.]